MASRVETLTPANTPRPISPYNHIAKAWQFITIGGTGGVNPATGELAPSENTPPMNWPGICVL